MRVGLGLPMMMGVPAEVVPGLMALAVEAKAYENVGICSAIDMVPYHVARNAVVDQAIKNDCDVLIFIDTDGVIAPGSLTQLMVTWGTTDAAVVTSHCYRRGFPFTNTWFMETPDGSIAQADVRRDATEPVALAGCGFPLTLIDVKWALARIPTPWFELGDKAPGGCAGEDWLFCTKVRRAGGVILGDPKVRVGHLLGRIAVTDDNVDALRRAEIGRTAK